MICKPLKTDHKYNRWRKEDVKTESGLIPQRVMQICKKKKSEEGRVITF
jgi:hypothetical protein